MTCTTYQQAIDYIFGRINYERMGTGAYSARDLKPVRMSRLLQCLGHPERDIPVVHIAGTKGKGSTASMVAGMLTAAGYRTGLFTSPHVHQFEERLRVDGTMPEPDHVVELVNRCAACLSSYPESEPTYFELATALAWLYFRDRMTDIAVLEVGLGGRLDATNICHPAVTVITNISFDHTKILGSSIEQITREKAGIVKAGIPLVTGVRQAEAIRVVRDVSRRCESAMLLIERDYRLHGTPESGGPFTIVTPWRRHSDLCVPLPGRHQIENATTALTTIDVLREQGWTIPDAALREGLATVHRPVCIETVATRPVVVIDAAHNEASVAALVRTLNELFPQRPRTLVFASSRDKAVAGMLKQLVPEFDNVLLTCYISNPRAVTPQDLLSAAQDVDSARIRVVADPATAWNLARRETDESGLICITGSFFIAAEVRQMFFDATAGRDSKRTLKCLAPQR